MHISFAQCSCQTEAGAQDLKLTVLSFSMTHCEHLLNEEQIYFNTTCFIPKHKPPVYVKWDFLFIHMLYCFNLILLYPFNLISYRSRR